MICPICNTEQPKERRCIKCGSLERHRLYYLFFEQELPDNIKFLHIAPSRCIRKYLQNRNVDYHSIDLERADIQSKQDITKLAFKDGVFDYILCSHVLEHIKDEQLALLEIYRILKKDGKAILQVPLNATLKSFEFDKPDGMGHVRQYGYDYYFKLDKAGFDVKINGFGKWQDLEKYNLKGENLYICRKV